MTSADQTRTAKRTRIDELFESEGVSPPQPTNSYPIPPHIYDQVRSTFTLIYASQLDKFLETSWFYTRGLDYLLRNHHLLEHFGCLIERMSTESPNPTSAYNAATRSLEAKVLWYTMSLVRIASNPDASGKINPADLSEGVLDAAKRVEIVENLLLGQHIDSDRLPPTEYTRNGTAFESQMKQQETEFWRLAHDFLTIRDDEASSSHQLDAILADCRKLLLSKENRDVLYSIAVIRLHGQRENLGNGGSDSLQKVDVAKNFIEAQARGKATNQLVMQLCAMAVRSWSLPR